MQLLKEESDDVVSARKAFHNVEKKVGGLTGASAVSQLPRNTKQVYNVKNMKAKSMGNIREDPLFWSVNSTEMEDEDVSRYIIPVVRERVISENAELAGFP